MALRKWTYGVALAIALLPAMADAQQTADCLADAPDVTPQARVPEQDAATAAGKDGLVFSGQLSELGDAALERGDLATAEKVYRRALLIREKLAPRGLPVAETLNALANVVAERGELALAQKYLERSLSIRQALAPGSREVALSLSGLGALARRRGDLAGEDTLYRQALELRSELRPADLADIFDGLGSICAQTNCAQKPEYYLSTALQLRQQSQPDSLGLATTLGFLGRSANTRGDLQAAEQDFMQALGLRRRLAPGSMALAWSLNDLGVLARARGNLATAEQCFQRALQIRQHWAPRSLAIADSLHNLGIVFWMRDDLEGAQRYFEQATRLRRRLAPHGSALAQSLIWQGILCARRDRLADAETYLKQALELVQKTISRDGPSVASVLSNLGSVARIRGELALSQEYYRKAFDIQSRQGPDSPAAASSLHALGGLLRQQGDLASAESYYRRALDIQQQEVPNSSAYAATLFAFGSLLRQEKKRQDAEPVYAQALDVLERQAESLGGTPEDRSVFRARFENNYRDYADLLVAMGRTEPALRVLERARARGLLEMLSEARVALRGHHDNGLDRLGHSLEEEIGARSSYRIRLLNDSHTAAQLSEVDRQLADLWERYRATQEEIRLRSPAYAALTQPQTLSGQQIQDLLDDDTLLLEYSLGPGASHLWAVTRTTMAVYNLPPRKVIEQAVARVRELLTARARLLKETQARRHRRLELADVMYASAARELSRLVLGPVGSVLENRRLVIVSDGALQYIPFAALPAPSGSATDGADDPLVLQHEVVNLPSASVLAELRQEAAQRVPAPKGVAIFADPVFDQRDERIQLDEARVATGSGNLDRLPWTRLEAAQILKVMSPGEGWEALDFEANRATAMSPLLANYRIVHFATHAVSDGEHPERSGLVLSLFDRRGQPQNGFLGLEQIYGLNLRADLVVLSACDTGLGQQVEGEGLIGLVRGFMYAGATRVVASLWSVDDEVTAQLMASLYKNLQQKALSPLQGATPAAALRAAQMEIRKEARWRSPYYWAGFELQGEWRGQEFR